MSYQAFSYLTLLARFLRASPIVAAGIKGLCATVGTAKTVTLTKCATPVAVDQKWKYDNATLQLTTGDGLCVTAAGAGPGPSPIKAEGMIPSSRFRPVSLARPQKLFLGPKEKKITLETPYRKLSWAQVTFLGVGIARAGMILGRPLASKGYAVLFLNNRNESTPGLTIGLAPTLWGWPVWDYRSVFSVISYIAFSY
jgi:hypothetical protein